MLSFRFLIAISSLFILTSADRATLKLRMPDVRPDRDDAYLCSASMVDTSQDYYIVGFDPRAYATKVHHMIVYGCSRPGKVKSDTPRYVWQCGHMSQKEEPNAFKTDSYDQGPICADGTQSHIVYSWALDAPALELPSEVGYRIGLNSKVHYLILQVHYSHTQIFRDNPDMMDSSGVDLQLTYGSNHGITKQAGVYLFSTNGIIRRGRSIHRAECRIYENKDFHPFRFRVHTHSLGVKVGAYKTSLGKGSKQELIGERNPQEPQMFYPVENDEMIIGQGDLLSAYCMYNNTRDHDVDIGHTTDDEMCNFYIYYWVQGDTLLNNDECFEWNT